jgi:CysZ protein
VSVQTSRYQPLANNGAGYFFKGFQLIQQKGIRRFVYIPLLVNLLLFSIAFYYLFKELEVYIAMANNLLPDWMLWLEYLLWPLAVISLLVIFSFLFSSIANWLAAPFNGLLAEKVEDMLTGAPRQNAGFSDIIKDTPRTLGREWTKLTYYLPRAIGFFLLMLLLPGIGQLIWFLFVAWMMAIQYCDYPFDNHKISFDEMKYQLKNHKGHSYSFGIMVSLFAMIPLVNLVVMPVAICGATALWVDNYRQDYL